MEEQLERNVEAPVPLEETTQSAVADELLEIQEAPARTQKKRKRKTQVATLEEKYIIKLPNKSELPPISDIFEALEMLRAQVAGAELLRESDRTKLAFTTRQQPPKDVMPTAPISYRRR